MPPSSSRRAGRHFLQIPGPTNVPDRVLRAIDFPTMDHRSPDFAALGKGCLAGMKRVFKSTQGEVVIYPASGTGAWEAALVNTLSAGDRVLMAETGHFATLWQKLAGRMGLTEESDPVKVEFALRELLPERDWSIAATALIWHGRRVCGARRPDCESCALRADCPFP